MGSIEPFRYELAWAADRPVLTNPELGLDVLVDRGTSYSFTSDITLLDSTDRRLLRAGVVLAHRVIEGIGEWYMDAPIWQPWLPVDHSVALGMAGDLPRDYICLIKPFLRGVPLAPVAALTCQRVELAMKDDHDETTAIIRDDRITVTQSGVTTSRVREITITPQVDPTAAQHEWVTNRILALGGTPVQSHPSVIEHLGAGAGVLSDYPLPPRHIATKIDAFVSDELHTCLRRIVESDLSARSQGMDFGDHPTHHGEAATALGARRDDELLGLGSDPVDTADGAGIHDELHGPIDGLLSQIVNLQQTVDGLSGILDPQWTEELETRVEPLLQLNPDEVSVHLLPESYFRMLDFLVVAARGPRLVVDPAQPVQELLDAQLDKAVEAVMQRCSQLTIDDDCTWQRARRVVHHAMNVAQVVPHSRRAHRIKRRLGRIADAMAGTGSVIDSPTPSDISHMTPMAAYEAGRETERRIVVQRRLRAGFADDWPKLRSKLRKVVKA